MNKTLGGIHSIVGFRSGGKINNTIHFVVHFAVEFERQSFDGNAQQPLPRPPTRN